MCQRNIALGLHTNIHMVQFFGGVARLLIPDNLKTGIVSNRKHEDPVVNQSYKEFAEHYHTAILPARVLAPKDKAAVEGNVGNVTSQIIAKLRNEKFFSIAELNRAIAELLEKFNKTPFQKRDGSRLSVFLEEEAPFLQSLPALPYEYAHWKQATVQLNYHVSVDSQNYSCSYPDKFSDMTFDERMTIMINKEYDARTNNRIRRLLKKSGLPYTKASICDIAYLPERQLNRELINRLGTCDFISQKRNVLILGATGAGKTFLANAIAADACRDGWYSLYIRLPDFFIEYANAAVLHKEFEILKKYQKASLLVLDEFLLIPADDNQQRILLELLERRYGRSSTIFCSQFSPEGWHDQLGGSAIADSILDRITPNSYSISIHGDVSMRQRLSEND